MHSLCSLQSPSPAFLAFSFYDSPERWLLGSSPHIGGNELSETLKELCGTLQQVWWRQDFKPLVFWLYVRFFPTVCMLSFGYEIQWIKSGFQNYFQNRNILCLSFSPRCAQTQQGLQAERLRTKPVYSRVFILNGISLG